MESVLTRLYRGEIYPSEQVVPTSEEFKAAKEDRNQKVEKLEGSLTKEQTELLTEMLDADAYAVLLQFEAIYAEGVRFGIQLMRELFPLEKPEWAGKQWPGE